MGKKDSRPPLQGDKQEFLKIFNSLIGSRSAWQVWEDVITAMACTLSNAAEPDPVRREKREKEYERAIKDYKMETIAEMFSIVTLAYDHDPDQDFLGSMYMNLNLGSHWHGQFFTPYDVCRLMAEVTLDEDKVKQQVGDHGWISLNDPACGAGATLIAAANGLRRLGINYQTQAAFVGNDIDRVVAKMCYIQLSLLGCPGYIAVANTLSDPVTGNVLFPDEKESQDFWYTPFWWSDVWTIRRSARVLDKLLNHSFAKEPKGQEPIFFFDFGKETA